MNLSNGLFKIVTDRILKRNDPNDKRMLSLTLKLREYTCSQEAMVEIPKGLADEIMWAMRFIFDEEERKRS